MKLIVGLGNPGGKYEPTKHNVGFWVIDAFAKHHQLTFANKKGEAEICRGKWSGPGGTIDFLLAKPQTFMNLSGRSVQTLLNYFKIPLSELILVFDDLNLDVGRIRIRKEGSDGGHRGVASVIQEVGSDRFLRLRIGIGKDPLIDASNYVLSPFRGEEQKIIVEAVDKSVALLPLLIEDRIDEAMNKFNAT